MLYYCIETGDWVGVREGKYYTASFLDRIGIRTGDKNRGRSERPVKLTELECLIYGVTNDK